MEKKKKANTEGKSTSQTIQTARKLLESGDTNMAATYFWYAGNEYQKSEEYELSGSAYEKAAYCYELDGRWDKAGEEYLSASKMYGLAGLPVKAKAMKKMANDNIQKTRKE